MTCHPAELGVHDIARMNRATLINSLLAFNEYSGLRFRRELLTGFSNTALRQTLLDVRRHYQARGY